MVKIIINIYDLTVLTFCIQAVHHRLNYVQFGLDGEVDEIGVYQNVVRWTKLSIVLEEQT